MNQSLSISTLPRATLRLQMNHAFTFAHARAHIPYFAQLGVSHLYLSPILTARAGSMHGYDVVDHSAINPELGGENEFRALVAALRAQRMGVIVDIVPNHMAVGGNDNKLWLDVLEWGAESRYAEFFDIDWNVPDPALRNRLLAPFLGKAYGEVLHAGEITLRFDAARGRFSFHYFEHQFPLAPHTYALLLRLGDAPLATRAQQFRGGHGRGDSATRFAENCAELANAYRRDPACTVALHTLLQRFDTRTADGAARVHGLLQRQHYRLASWRTAADEINWRRFFDVIQLAGLRVQAPSVFEIVHATTLRLYAEGLIDGVRIDHIDGLAYPRDYCHQLRRQLKRLTSQRPPHAAQGPAYCIVEKILAPDERLPRDWRVDGTTGYSFMNEVGALLHDADGEAELAECWSDISGRADDFGAEMKRARQRILRDLLAAEFSACAYALHRIARDDIATRDWSLFAIRRTLAELLIHFPIYRTYADGRGRSASDNATMQHVKAEALPHCRPSDAALLDHIDDWLGREAPRHVDSPTQRRARLHAIGRFQQLSAPLAAKAVEDTAFYRYSKLLSRNEVGAIPTQFALAPAAFHRELSRRAHYFPRALLATATHDHKRGEDLRARLAVLSEIPAQWREHVRQWRQMNAHHKIEQRLWPQLADEYMIYQMLAGGWPLTLQPSDQIGMHTFCERLAQWLLKALREAKNITSWTEPNTAYESACKYFLYQLLDTSVSPNFINSLFRFVESIAAVGALNGLTQTLLKLTAPGVPDIYQGTEWWDFSFADPDNRQPVDFAARAKALTPAWSPALPSARPEHLPASPGAPSDQLPALPDNFPSLLENWRDGRIKQKVIHCLLRVRSSESDLFARGTYNALPVIGEQAAHVFAFVRQYRRRYMIVIVPRLAMALCEPAQPAIIAARWNDTRIELPKAFTKLIWKSCLYDSNVIVHDDKLMLADILHPLPFAVLLSNY